MSFRELIDLDALQKLQDEYCQVTGIYCYCLDEQRHKITRMSGDEEGVAVAGRYIGSMPVLNALERVEDGSLEDVAIEDLDFNQGKVAAARIMGDKEAVLYFVAICIAGKEGMIDEYQLEGKLDLLRDMVGSFCKNYLAGNDTEVAGVKVSAEDSGREDVLRMVDATTQVVQLFDSHDAIESVFAKWLEIVAQCVNADTAQIFKVYDENRHADILNEWKREGKVSVFDKTTMLECRPGMTTERPLVVDQDMLQTREYSHLRIAGTKASMIFPIIRQEKGGNMVLFLNRRHEEQYSISEIKFATDSVKVLQNILIQRIQKNSLASSYASLEAILDNLSSCIYVEDRQGKLLFANKKLRATFDKELRDGYLLELIAGGLKNYKEGSTTEIYHKDRAKWYDFATKEILWMDQSRVRLYTLHDITDKKEYQRKIEQQAFTDFLTGLYNRMCCERDLAKFIDEAQNEGTKGALLYMDLDDFKHINDALGHQYGDALLKAISHSLLRIEGIENTCYRMGGDEFVIIIAPQAFGRFDGIIDDIKKIFSRPWFLKDTDYYCTMSMGIVIFPELGESVVDLVKKADIAMYEAKKSGKNRVARYSDDINSVSGRRLDMEKNMRDATVEGYDEFEVYYQPIIDITDGTTCAGAEALIRWNSSKLGFIPPSEFIPLAEYLGLINPIGNFVLEEACIQCKKWNDEGKPYKVNVNLSVVQLLQPDIVTIVKEILEKTGLMPEHLTLEVTESLAINDMERMKGILAGIKSLGVKLALDDFGTGYSSLNHIREIPFDVIKVDQSFVKNLAEDAYAKSFVKMVAELAEAIGVNICVEGIETLAQYEVLQNMKVKYIQGYYFDKPLRRSAFEEKYVKES